MSGGTGVSHSEYNLESVTTKIFQIWIIPTRSGGAPQWGSKPFPRRDRSARLVTLASGHRDDAEALPIRADARVLGAYLKAGERVSYPVEKERRAYLVAATGVVSVNGVRAAARDGVAIADVTELSIVSTEDAEILLVDVVGGG
jgi:quercetin 2,3-dioxygenase